MYYAGTFIVRVASVVSALMLFSAFLKISNKNSQEYSVSRLKKQAFPHIFV